jgi:hypothetical protein
MVRAFGDTRTCAEDGCTAQLSRYNPARWWRPAWTRVGPEDDQVPVDHVVQHDRVGARVVGDDLDRGDLRRAEGPLEEPAGSGRVAPWGDEHADDLAELVDRSVDVAPAAGDLHIGLVDLPAITDGMAAGPGSLGQQRREPLDPPVDGDVVDSTPRSASSSSTSRYDSAKRRYQRTASTITSGGKQKPAKADRATAAERGRRVLMAAVWLLPTRSQQLQQCRWRDSIMRRAIRGLIPRRRR